MDFFLLGLNHKNTPIEIRERLAFSPKRVIEALSQLTKNNGSTNSEVPETVILSTCNRVEIYAVRNDAELAAGKIKSFLSDFHQIHPKDFEGYLYTLSNRSAIEHLFCVTSGINSMVMGESQIQGQVKEAFELAQQSGTAGVLLSTLFGSALRVGKRARTETEISKHFLSISGAAVNLVRTAFPDISDLNILIIGIGEMSLIAIKTLFQLGAQNVTIINRSQERTKNVQGKFHVRALGFDRLQESLGEADVVICSTGAPHAVLTLEAMKNVLKKYGERCRLIIDIAVPRDVEPEIGKLPNIQLYNIDQLETQIEENLERRCSEINRVQDIINEEVANFMAWYQSLKAKPVITKLRHRGEKIREQELQRAFRKFKGTLSDKDAEVMQDLSRRIVNKLLHQPLTRLREEASEGNGDHYAAAVQNLFDLEDYPQNK